MSLDQDFPWIEVGAFDPNAPQGFVRNKMIHLDGLAKWRERYSNRGVYCTAYCYQSQDRKGDLMGHYYVDFDCKDDYAKVKADAIRFLVIMEALFGIKSEDLWIFFSGQKGIHIIVPAPVMGIGPHPHLNEIFKYLSTSLGSQVPHQTVDLRVYDRVRLFRLPNSQHQKSDFYKVPLSPDELIRLDLPAIQALAQGPRPWNRTTPRYSTKAAQAYAGYVRQWESSKLARKFSQKQGARTLDFTPPCVQHMLKQGTMEGHRNQTLAVLANHFRQIGRSEDHTIDTLIRWNEKRVNPPVPESEIINTVRSIFTREYSYGCSTLERLAPCDKDNCKFGKYKAN